MPISTINSAGLTNPLTGSAITSTGGGSVSSNTAYGTSALVSNTSGAQTASFGFNALYTNSTGSFNTAFGSQALTSNTTASNNTGVGTYALLFNSTGASNTAVGSNALYSNTTGVENIALGYQAGYTNTTGANSVYLGNNAGYTRNANGNVCVGYNSGYFGTTGTFNTLVGYNSGSAITTGAKNTVLGAYNGNQGGLDIRTASNHIVLSDGDGNPRLFFTADGSFNVATAYSATTANAANLNIGSDGYFRRSTSSLKYKRDVQDATHGLAEILQLRPVTYKGKDANDGDTVFGGLIAEEVHEIGLTEFVQYADDGTPDALAYGNMVSVLVKAIQELKADLDATKAELAALKGQA